MDKQVTQFTEALGSLNEGRTAGELSRRMHEVIEAVRETGKGGKLTLTISVARHKRNADYIEIEADVKVQTPKENTPATFFLFRNGRLLGLNEMQQPLFPEHNAQVVELPTVGANDFVGPKEIPVYE